LDRKRRASETLMAAIERMIALAVFIVLLFSSHHTGGRHPSDDTHRGSFLPMPSRSAVPDPIDRVLRIVIAGDARARDDLRHSHAS
jgi:hypothetical protein